MHKKAFGVECPVARSLESIGEVHDRSRATLGAEFIRFVENTVDPPGAVHGVALGGLEIGKITVEARSITRASDMNGRPLLRVFWIP